MICAAKYVAFEKCCCFGASLACNSVIFVQTLICNRPDLLGESATHGIDYLLIL